MDTATYLNKDVIQNIPAISAINKGTAEIIKSDGRGVIFYNKATEGITVSSDDNSILKEGLDEIKDSVTDFLSLREKNTEYIKSRYDDIERITVCYQVVYKQKIDIPEADNFSIKPLDISHFEIVREHYKLIPNDEYIKDRLRSNVMLGAYVDGVLAGFAGRHDEGSMGMLEVFPEYRRNGLGYFLAAHLINKIIDGGEIPYGHVIENNYISLSLQKKLGAKIASEKIAWIDRKIVK